MKQVVQSYKTGELRIEEVPAPLVRSGFVLIKNKSSLISAGTERTKIETAKMNLVEKAISRLDLVKTVVNNIKQEGLVFTLKKAFNKLDTPISLGYSSAGEVIEIGEGIADFKIGDRVAYVGEIYAAHSEINLTPDKFCVKYSEKISYEEASFVGLGAIALNSAEIAQLREKENVVVIGLGLIGQIVTQIVKTKGCHVLGVEIDEEKIMLAKKLGLDNGINPSKDDLETAVNNFTEGNGADAVIIAAASNNNLPIEMAGKIARDKGRVILVGAMPIVISRKEFYEKELFFIISRGFGAGLYNKLTKDRSYTYNYKPITVKENMQKFLSLVAERKVNVKDLITHRFKLSEATNAYEIIRTNKEKYMGMVFAYDEKLELNRKIEVSVSPKTEKLINIGFIGAGSFAQGYILPVLKKMENVNLLSAATANGINANSVAKKFGFQNSSTDFNEILNNEKINCVFITTRHNLHAKMVIESLKKGKNVFVEKPLCLNESELKEIVSCYDKSNSLLMVGFNRRFSPFIQETKKFFEHRTGPLMINYRVNAGYLPANHWVHDSNEGGGRIVGEICHFVDLLQYLVNAVPINVYATVLEHPDKTQTEDNVSVILKFTDGSIGTISYSSIGDISFSRERIEIFGDNSVAVIDNFKEAVFSRAGNIVKKIKKYGRDMGHNNEIKLFINSLTETDNKKSIISFNEIVNSTLTTFKISESLKVNLFVKI